MPVRILSDNFFCLKEKQREKDEENRKLKEKIKAMEKDVENRKLKEKIKAMEAQLAKNNKSSSDSR